MHINRYKHTHWTLPCSQHKMASDIDFHMSTRLLVLAGLNHLSLPPAASSRRTRHKLCLEKMGLWKLRVQCLKKNSGFAANFAEKLAWRPHHVLEPADKSAWFPTHGRFKWDVPWRLEETFDTARTSHDVQHKNQQHVPFQKKNMPHFHQVFELHVVCKSGFLRKGGWQPGTNSQIIVWVSKNLGRCHRSTRTICTQWAKQRKSHHSEELRSVGDAGVCHQDSSVYRNPILPGWTLFVCPLFDHLSRSVCVFLQHQSETAHTENETVLQCLNISTDIFGMWPILWSWT